MLWSVVRYEGFISLSLYESKTEQEALILRRLHGLHLKCGMTVSGYFRRTVVRATAGLPVVKAPPLRLRQREAARLQRSLRLIKMSKARVERGRELLNVEIRRHPFTVTALEIRKAASVVALKA